MSVRVSRRTRRILDAIHTLDKAWGLTICQASGLGPGTVYPALERLLAAGWIGARVESDPPDDRPPRTFYHLTVRGQLGGGLQPAAASADCEHSFPDPHPHPMDQIGDCRQQNDGPSVAEAAANDRRWPLEKAGE